MAHGVSFIWTASSPPGPAPPATGTSGRIASWLLGRIPQQVHDARLSVAVRRRRRPVGRRFIPPHGPSTHSQSVAKPHRGLLLDLARGHRAGGPAEPQTVGCLDPGLRNPVRRSMIQPEEGSDDVPDTKCRAPLRRPTLKASTCCGATSHFARGEQWPVNYAFESKNECTSATAAVLRGAARRVHGGWRPADLNAGVEKLARLHANARRG